MANAFLPEGRFILAASQINAVEAAHETSLAFFNLKCHVRLPLPGLDEGSVTSAAVRIITVLSLCLAVVSLFICVAVKTSCGFCNSPEPAISSLDGAVIE